MICLLRCISRKLCCTSILQHPREPRPLARKCSKSQRATRGRGARLFAHKGIRRHVLSESRKKGEENGPRTYTTTVVWSVIANGNKPNGIVD